MCVCVHITFGEIRECFIDQMCRVCGIKTNVFTKRKNKDALDRKSVLRKDGIMRFAEKMYRRIRYGSVTII